MSERNKLIFGAIFVISWIGFWKWADSTLPEESKVEVAQNLEAKDSCFNLSGLKESLEESASKMAGEANKLQKSLLRERLTQIVREDILSGSEDKILSEYLSYDLMKIATEKLDAFGDAMVRNIEIRPQVVKIVNKLIKSGAIEPYLFSEVQQMGQDLRAKFKEASDLTNAHPDCFKSTLEIDKLIDEATEKLGLDKSDNGWIKKKTADELVDSIL